MEARAWQLTLDEEAFLATTGEPGLLILATYDGELTTEGSGGRASIVGLPPEPGSTLGLVEWTRADDRLLLAWFSWDGTDYTEFLVSVMAGAGPS